MTSIKLYFSDFDFVLVMVFQLAIVSFDTIGIPPELVLRGLAVGPYFRKLIKLIRRL